MENFAKGNIGNWQFYDEATQKGAFSFLVGGGAFG